MSIEDDVAALKLAVAALAAGNETNAAANQTIADELQKVRTDLLSAQAYLTAVLVGHLQGAGAIRAADLIAAIDYAVSTLPNGSARGLLAGVSATLKAAEASATTPPKFRVIEGGASDNESPEPT